MLGRSLTNPSPELCHKLIFKTRCIRLLLSTIGNTFSSRQVIHRTVLNQRSRELIFRQLLVNCKLQYHFRISRVPCFHFFFQDFVILARRQTPNWHSRRQMCFMFDVNNMCRFRKFIIIELPVGITRQMRNNFRL
jgi:hypothetical protein